LEGFNPNIAESVRDNSPYLIVANLPYIQANMALEPYEVWLKKAAGATSEQIYNDIEDKKLRIKNLDDSGQMRLMKF
jgi:putative ABC transport system permease protein